MRVLMLSACNERTLRPSNNMSPDAKGSIFRSAKHKLVLPARAAPTTARRLPGCTPKLTFDRDVLDAKCFDGSRVLHAEASDGGGAVV